MHKSSFDKMQKFRDKYLEEKVCNNLNILDLGSQDVNGSYKTIFDHENWHYTGADMTYGQNVDTVLTDPYCWREVPSCSIDIVVSGQTFEHIEYIWLTILEIERVLKPGGLCCIIAPSRGDEHRYPVDCWRFYPDGLSALARYARMIPVEVATQWETGEYPELGDAWGDSFLVARKPRSTLLGKVRTWLKRSFIQLSYKL